MKGAVLYKLGLDLVRTRIMRSSYGTELRLSFKEGIHRESRKVYDYDNLPRCEGCMYWFAKKASHFISGFSNVKGLSIESGTIIEKNIYSDYHSNSASCFSTNLLWICEEDDPPEYLEKRRISVLGGWRLFQ
jgi:hypothetical protein